MTSSPIAVVGMACRYPDACTPLQLWENVLAGRRAFRRLLPQRLPLDDYASDDRTAPDVVYQTRAALLDGYHFDRVRFRVSAATFNAADLVHWLALDVATEALQDAGFTEPSSLPREETGVLVGNTLTGEFSRAAALRVRWPYVRRVIDTALEDAGESFERRTTLLPRIETLFKAPFAPVDGETLAGSLSNTIAGRICNYFNLKGGGYTVDGACASSLLAVAHACSALAAGDLSVAVAGGVDLSLDAFELVGFAKAGALASDDMRVYDASPTGFWPGEGAGFVVLMRESDALAIRRRIYAVVRGWGISSDGSGGMTRPELEGQLLAIERAYARSGVGVDTVAFFEGHGTGTAVGDATELTALSEARRRSGRSDGRAAIGSIKSNIGHTKAAAGIAGFIKATLSVHRHLIPPATGCRNAHPLLTAPDAALYLPDRATPWPLDTSRRAGVSAMGFGGINVHVVVEGRDDVGITRNDGDMLCARSFQDAELVVLSATRWDELRDRVDRLLSIAPDLSIAEVTDLAVDSQRNVADCPIRAALLVSTPEELIDHLHVVRDCAVAGRTLFDAKLGSFVGGSEHRARVAFVFPGQGAPVRTNGGIWSRRYPEIEDLYWRSAFPEAVDALDTAVAQPAILTGCIAATEVLRSVGLDADVGIGHSLGELAALWWAGAFDAHEVIALASTRGRLMRDLAAGPGAMAILAASLEIAQRLLSGTAATVAAINGSNQITIAGRTREIDTVLTRARQAGISASQLRVAHAFHSSLMAPVASEWRKILATTSVHPIKRAVVSTVTGEPIGRESEVPALLERQLCEPVRFTDALRAAGQVELFIEAGPGQALAALAAAATGVPAVSVDAASESVRGLLTAIGSAFALGAFVDLRRMAYERFARPFDLDHPKEFLVNQCERTRGARVPAVVSSRSVPAVSATQVSRDAAQVANADDTCAVLRTLVGRAADLPLDAVGADARFLTDLHLNSLTVSELLAAAARCIGVSPPAAPTDYADVSIAEAARALDSFRLFEGAVTSGAMPEGLDNWVRAFTIVEQVEPIRPIQASPRRGKWRVVSSREHSLRDALCREFANDDGGPGIVVCMDPGFPPSLDGLLQAAQTALRERLRGKFIVVQEDAVAGGFARTLFLESTHLDVCIVTVDFSQPDAAALVHAEACAAAGCVDVRYGPGGTRLVPTAMVAPLKPNSESVRLGPEDVLLVTGGGKGIAAECAMALAAETGVRLVLMGRTRPELDDALSANLDRIHRSGATVRYVAADVTDEAQVHAAIGAIREEYGEVTAVLHAAGVNTPALIAALDGDAIEAAVRPKVGGARNVLSALDPARLRLFISFGSIIARTGLPGEAHYAVANEWLQLLTTRLSKELTACHVMTIEWSVWAAAGMGERLGRLDALTQRGIAAITVDGGVALLKDLLRARLRSSAVLAIGRMGQPSVLRLAGTELPWRRFIESPRVHYPGVELVADASVSAETDPYLSEHCLDDQMLLPAVIGMEAMAQAAMAVCGASQLPVLEQLEFSRPIVVPRNASLILRTMAIVDTDGRVRVALRADTTGFVVNHFQGVCIWPAAPDVSSDAYPQSAPAGEVLLNPAIELYGSLLFQSGRFARVQRYHRLLATECTADLADGTSSWFGQYLPDALILGDPGARDAVLHCIQASIPHRRVVPVGVERVVIFRPLRAPCRIYGHERCAIANEFNWDIDVCDMTGTPIERWRGLRFRSISEISARRLPPALLTPYLQRQLAALGHPFVDLRIDANGRSNRTRRPRESCRPDGKPDQIGEVSVSTAHTRGLTVHVTGPGSVGCDVERVVSRPPRVWRDLLGNQRIAVAKVIAGERNEADDASATRVWTALESLKKAGASPNVPLVFQGTLDDGWVELRASGFIVSTWIGDVDQLGRIAFAVAMGESHAAV